MDRHLAAPVIADSGEILHNNKLTKKSAKKGLNMIEKAEKSHASGAARTLSVTELEEMTERTYKNSAKMRVDVPEPETATTVKDSLKSKLKNLKSQVKRTKTMKSTRGNESPLSRSCLSSSEKNYSIRKSIRKLKEATTPAKTYGTFELMLSDSQQKTR